MVMVIRGDLCQQMLEEAGVKVSLQTRRDILQYLAPQYQQASSAERNTLVDEFTAITGYHRRYARWLLNHAEAIQQAAACPKQRYGPEIQQALLLAWNAANRICAKRLIPFLPTLIDALERHGHLRLSEESRRCLLSMSVATADRLLRTPRHTGRRGLSTTQAGTLLKRQIPIRTFREWDEAQPGFVEVDVVAHCGMHTEGRYLSTLTLTDIATGWTECLPLRQKGQDAVVAALHQARTLFPFPILGLDTDNGSEFINEAVVAYCAREHITFTRGRPHEKNDQCFVEEKNRVVVRQVVGYDRLVGEQAYQQLGELYGALRLYVNCFQPSMKLIAKHREGRTVRREYDAAKTPLQRLLLSGALPAAKQQELRTAVQVLDPIRLFRQVERLQQAVFRCAVSASFLSQHSPPGPLQVFSLEACTGETLVTEEVQPKSEARPEEPSGKSADLVCASSPCQAGVSIPIHASERSPRHDLTSKTRADRTVVHPPATAEKGQKQVVQMPRGFHPPPEVAHRTRVSFGDQRLTIEEAIQRYLHYHQRTRYQLKTVIWHQTALGQFHRYLLVERHLHLVSQISEADVHDWFAFLQETPGASGKERSAHSIATYVRSVRAFCAWLVRQGALARSPCEDVTVPRAVPSLPPALTAEDFNQLLQACPPPGESGPLAERAAARNRAILWVLFDSGISLSELCALRVGDVESRLGVLTIRGHGARARSLSLGAQSWQCLRSYLEQHRPTPEELVLLGRAKEDHLFLSES